MKLSINWLFQAESKKEIFAILNTLDAKSLDSINFYDIKGKKVEELAIISEVGEEDALEAEFAGVRYFIRYGNFEF